MAPHPKAKHSQNLRKAKGQAEEGIKGSVVRQGKPTVELAESGPLSGACARAHITILPTPPRAGVVALHDCADSKRKQAAAVNVKGRAQVR